MDSRIEFLRRAMRERLIVKGWHAGLPCEFCPHILGTREGEWRLVAWQVGGRSPQPLPPGGDWRCFNVSDLRHLTARPGTWCRGADAPRDMERCIERVAATVDVGRSRALSDLAPPPARAPSEPADKLLRRRVLLVRQAIRFRIPMTGSYGGRWRAFCPHVLGRKHGVWQTLVWQYAGEAATPLPPEGAWRCFVLRDLEDVALQHGQWHRGSVTGYGGPTCVDEIDAHVDPADGPEVTHVPRRAKDHAFGRSGPVRPSD